MKFCNAADITVCTEDVFKDKGLRSVLSIDLSFKWDFTSFSLMFFSPEDQTIFIAPMMFLANLENRSPSQKVLFSQWDKSGYIRIMRKKAMPTERVIKEVKLFLEEKKIKPDAVISDFALSKQWQLEKHWPGVQNIWMSPREMTGPLRWLQDRIQGKKVFLTEENPAAIWQFSCALTAPKSKNYCSLFKTHTHHSIDLPSSVALGAKYFSEYRKKLKQSFVIG